MISVGLAGAFILSVLLVLWLRETPPAFEPYEDEKVEDLD